jgi:DHA1 family bicyclomycin/chloramphenicol resistance-like MFS transporter
MTNKRYFFLILILGSLTALGPFSIDMYLPGFPAIAKDLDTTIEGVTLSLSSYFIGISAGQLLYGPLLDKYGRKKPLYAGLAVYIIASAGCMFAADINSLIVLRFIQALGSCAAAVAAVAMVRDLFPVKDNAKVFALLMLVVGASPMIAPTVGGYVTTAFGWHAVFLILGLLSILILFAVIFALPDKYQPDASLSLKPGPILNGFWTVLKQPQFYTYAFAGSIAFSGLFAYVAGSPLVFMKIYHVSEQNYGWIFAALSVGFIGSSQVNSLLLKRYRSEQIVPVALVCQVIVGCLFVLGAASNWLGLPGTLVMIFLFLCCIGITNPNALALSIAPFSANAGSASALMGAVQLGLGALASVAVGSFHSLTTIPLAAIMAGSSILAMMVFFIGRVNITSQVTVNANAAVSIH